MFHTLHHLLPYVITLALLLVLSLTLTPPTPTKVGALATLVWGTAPGGTAIAPVVTGIVVTSFKPTARNAGPVGNIENSDGALIESVYLDDGFEADVEGVYDTALTYPTIGSSVTITLPVTTTGLLDLSGGVVHKTFPCTLESNAPDFERKKEAMYRCRISHAPGRDGVAT